MKQISLTRGLVALVDDGDYEWLSKWSWYADKSHKNKWRAARKPDKIIYMHRVITEAAPKEIVDHIDGDPLNNQRKNLRIASKSQNSANSTSRKGTSVYKGVSRHQRGNCWRVTLTCNGKQKYIGHFQSEVDAAHAYDAAAKKIFGEFSRLNFPNGVST